MTNTLPQTHAERVAEITSIEAAAAQKRVELEAFNAAESGRRKPLNDLLQTRLNLKTVIERNKSTIAAHASDAAEFEKQIDNFFYHESGHQARCYSFAVASQGWPIAAAGFAVQKLTERLVKAEKDLADMESQIVALAANLDLSDILPPELRT